MQYLNVITGLISDGKTYTQASKYLQCHCGLSTGILVANIARKIMLNTEKCFPKMLLTLLSVRLWLTYILCLWNLFTTCLFDNSTPLGWDSRKVLNLR